MAICKEKHDRPRIVGDYVIGPRIGSGSFAVVWKSRHRLLGTQFAIKEINKKHLNENMLKEISILRRINHPNIIRLFDAIETDDKIFLVLEYCEGGDLGEYLHKHGRVSMDVARHFMRQLAAGLKVLNDNNLIHRDLKPQNLLLTTKGLTPQMKIGDFGFARYLTPQSLADTLCGSPLYMAPEIIQNRKYDAKADLWSVGAILYQLGMGRPPYGGNSQIELFQNILSSLELHFPEAALQVLNPDFVELCRRLLRRNPVERLTFEEFFCHNFLTESRNENLPSESCNDGKHLGDVGPSTSNYHKVDDSLELIERGYVLVHTDFASMESLTSSLERTLIDSSSVRASVSEIAKSSISRVGTSSNVAANVSMEGGPCELNPSARLQLLQQYIHALSVVAEEKINAESPQESVSVELAILCVWKKVIKICHSWVASSSSSSKKTRSTTEARFDLSKASAALAWAESGFVVACEHTEQLATHLHENEGPGVVPDVIGLLYQTAVTLGINGAVDELFENWDKAVHSYSRAMILLSFIISEAPSLSLSPPCSLHPSDKKRILNYITHFEWHKNRIRALQRPSTTH
ncbi:uncharacterized protein [Phyllobates terribilis]|uniref:uncharacterized protein n=1 Tax=Phyllobates terribilis TaxID=111132 RepID=UPI003CCA8084